MRFVFAFLLALVATAAPATTPAVDNHELLHAQEQNPDSDAPVRLVVDDERSTNTLPQHLVLRLVNDTPEPITFTGYYWQDALEASPRTLESLGVKDSAAEGWGWFYSNPNENLSDFISPEMWDADKGQWTGRPGGFCGTGSVSVIVPPKSSQPILGWIPTGQGPILRWNLAYRQGRSEVWKTAYSHALNLDSQRWKK